METLVSGHQQGNDKTEDCDFMATCLCLFVLLQAQKDVTKALQKEPLHTHVSIMVCGGL